MSKEKKTNVLKMLDRENIRYRHYEYEQTPTTTGVEVANMIGQDVGKVFKTLVTSSNTSNNYVFVIPVAEELDLKRAAYVSGEKKIFMEKSKALLSLTGYVHGGVSPIGMKKSFKTYLHSSAENLDTIIVSAGKLGHQVELSLKDLSKMVDFDYADLIKK